jgi:hypothetical protein
MRLAASMSVFSGVRVYAVVGVKIKIKTMTITVESEFDLDEYFPVIVRKIADKVKEDGYNTECIHHLQAAIQIPDPPELKIKNLPDKMKFEYLCKVWDKYTLEQLETLLPE